MLVLSYILASLFIDHVSGLSMRSFPTFCLPGKTKGLLSFCIIFLCKLRNFQSALNKKTIDISNFLQRYFVNKFVKIEVLFFSF